MSDSKSSGGTSGGIGFVGLLTIAFIVLKLCGVIDWSWVWVLAPIWITAALVAAVIVFFLLLIVAGAVLAALVGGGKSKRRWP